MALRAVQRQTAASRLARPLRSAQQGVLGGEPTTTLTKPNKSAHTPSLSVSVGQVGLTGGSFFGGFGVFGVFGGHFVEVTKVKKRRFNAIRRAVTARALEAIKTNFEECFWDEWEGEIGPWFI